MPKIVAQTIPPAALNRKNSLPVVVIDAGEKRRESAQHRDEAAEEDDLAAVPEEQILADLQSPLVEPHIVAEPVDERKAELSPDPIAAIVAEDRPGRRGADDAVEVELPLAGQDRRRDQHRFARHRNAGALQADDDENCEIAVGCEIPVQVMHKIHVRKSAFAPVRRRALARTVRRAGLAAAWAIPVRPIDTSLGERTPPNAAFSMKAPHAAWAAKAPSIAASTFSCTMSWASRAFSEGLPPKDIRSRVRAAMVSAASTPVWTLALAIASDCRARRFDTMLNLCSLILSTRRGYPQIIRNERRMREVPLRGKSRAARLSDVIHKPRNHRKFAAA